MSERLTLDPPTDGELLYRLSRGDEPAYRRLHDRHQMPVFRLSLVLMPTSRDAEEVAATAFFELWRKRDKVRVINGSVLPWLLATTSAIAKNGLQARRRYHRLLRRVLHDGDVGDHAVTAGGRSGILGGSSRRFRGGIRYCVSCSGHRGL